MKYKIKMKVYGNTSRPEPPQVLCELPGNLGVDRFMEMLRIYLFNDEYAKIWDEIHIVRGNKK
jgi:hypothetical protein